MNPYVWLDNRIVLYKDIDIPFCDEGFLYGQGLFETMRSYNGEVFLLDRHLKRLINSCSIMETTPSNIELFTELLRTAVLETVKSNKLNSGYIRLNVWKKGIDIGTFIFTKDDPFYLDRDYQSGFSAVICKDVIQNESSPLVRVKSLNHYFYILLREKAKDYGANETIILNSKGNICEGSHSNIFIIKDDIISTPPISSGCLPGITREVSIEIARQLKIVLQETDIKPEDLYTSDEAFLTNSLIEIMPLVKVDKKRIGNGKLGQKTKFILEGYRKLIRIGYK
ncbi:MAG: aminotransferase class IV family protein [Candidatus Omnitrophica bacterium]|nr:aminotransferase class IV family protein [Candidatus Omnitrophota bacterium]